MDARHKIAKFHDFILQFGRFRAFQSQSAMEKTDSHHVVDSKVIGMTFKHDRTNGKSSIVLVVIVASSSSSNILCKQNRQYSCLTYYCGGCSISSQSANQRGQSHRNQWSLWWWWCAVITFCCLWSWLLLCFRWHSCTKVCINMCSKWCASAVELMLFIFMFIWIAVMI